MSTKSRDFTSDTRTGATKCFCWYVNSESSAPNRTTTAGQHLSLANTPCRESFAPQNCWLFTYAAGSKDTSKPRRSSSFTARTLALDRMRYR